MVVTGDFVNPKWEFVSQSKIYKISKPKSKKNNEYLRYKYRKDFRNKRV